ncbi:hypothetical protein C8R43DRAFT_853713, partial [Mycena crocata]
GYGPLVPCTTITNNSSQRAICRKRFLRHPVVRAFLAEKFPRIPSPTLSHLHVSLANRSHIKLYIKEIRKIYCPHGTGWAG